MPRSISHSQGVSIGLATFSSTALARVTNCQNIITLLQHTYCELVQTLSKHQFLHSFYIESKLD